ncbi:phosphoglycerate kinase [Buchnera aphidicola (Hyadaphis tataricae)]|uniref:Phosphoglycerate kinase n=1 Tax=Buchnera aphidicola (Hyadaphis tataricae) TaxID=1241859 RepID=A0A4D6YB85_9GAMM|nr:phosphoglycerate kinase [Buchnera aphidicola]QCI21735.1 phosphoglycerate kinase [Buchnera aphidicola (Hyadaphis tataricae)]
MNIIKMNDLDITGKTILIRSDLNVPIKNGVIQSDARLLAALPTIELAVKKNAKIILMSHLGRPTEGYYEKKYSLFPIFEYFKKKLHYTKVYFCSNYLHNIKLKKQEIAILENVRFNKGELNNDDILSKKYSDLCDIFVMDAFGSSHRMQSSTYGVAKFSNIACAGPLLIKEINCLTKLLEKPKRPMVAIVGGSKVSTKFNLLKKISKLADTVIVGGGIANTFLAIDYNIGKSLYEKDFILEAKKIRDKYNIIIPIDSRVGKNFSETAISIIKSPYDIQQNEEIMDFGDKTIQKVIDILKESKTILWNGPVGVFEFPNFRKGTEAIAKTIAKSNAFSIAGGGDTLSVIDMFNIKNDISYISTGGGSFLEFIEGKKLPSIHILEERFKTRKMN